MIPLEKREVPTVLAENTADWTEQLLEQIRHHGSFPSEWARRRYGREEIKTVVVAETHKKCVYCESKIRQVYAGDIEHIRPKSRYPNQTFEWRNLTLACQECNRRKGNEWPEENPPINPFEEDPSEQLQAIGAFIKSRPGRIRGEITVGLVRLNRLDLLERRGEKISELHQLASRIASVNDDDLRRILAQQLEELTADSAEYTFISRAYVDSIRDDIRSAQVEPT